jgi:YVTN family beta-propeller protein
VDYRLLGPLEVRQDGRVLSLGGDRQRALLAILLLHANAAVSADELIDALWGERPPRSASNALRVHISRLRKAFENGAERSTVPSNGVLSTHGHGYMLSVESGQLDVDRFRDLVELGRKALAENDPAEAATLLRSALALWRGPPLADFRYEPFAQAAITRLEEMRLAAFEERIESDTALGRHAVLVAELAELVEQNPLRERLRAQLMLVLYRCGRQAEALDVYQEFRRSLSEQLGLDPGPGLQKLELAILSRDPSLELDPAIAPVPEEVAGSRAPPATESPIHRHHPRLAAGVVALLAIAVAVALVASNVGGASSPTELAANSVGAITSSSGALRATVPIGTSPSALAAGDGAVWVANYDAGTVSRIDPTTDAVVQTIPVGSTPSGIAVGAGAVWVANNYGGTVSRIDPVVNRVVQTISVGNAPSGVAVGEGSVWVTNDSDRTLTRIDAITGAVQKTIALGTGTSDVAAGLGAVWVSDAADGRVLRINPRSDQVVQVIDAGGGADALAVGDGSVWVANSLDGTVSRLDPQTGSVSATVAVGQGPAAIAAGAGGLWVANQFAGTVSRINPATDTVASTIAVGNRPQGLALADGVLWVGVQAGATSHRGGTLIALTRNSFGTVDPAVANGSSGGYLLTYTNDGLTAYPRFGGPQSARVVPDLAVSLPSPTDGGTTYTFQLRRGMRYSNGQPVRPEDLRRALQRDLELGPNLYYGGLPFANVVGAAACEAHPTRCDLSRGVVTDDAADTVTFHLIAPDPELLQKLALPDAVAVPAGTPFHDVGDHPIPATGPYEFAGYTQREIRLVRNPYFHVWSRVARPESFPDQIAIRIGGSPAAELTAVEQGHADYTFDGPPANRLSDLQTRFASRLYVNPFAFTEMLVLNTRVKPFDDMRVRQAINYAIDRGEIARLLGGGSVPTCQTLAPYIPGFRRYCPYTLDPSLSGAWRAPDLARAERLIAASHTRGAPIRLWNLGTFQADYNPVGRYLASLFDELGYRTRYQDLSSNFSQASGRFADSRSHVQAALTILTANYLSGSQMIQPDLSCQAFLPGSTGNGNLSEYCSPHLDQLTAEALTAEENRSPTATQLWAQADRYVTDQAVTVPLVTPSALDFVSARAGNYQYSYQFGVLLDQLWVRR